MLTGDVAVSTDNVLLNLIPMINRAVLIGNFLLPEGLSTLTKMFVEVTASSFNVQFPVNDAACCPKCLESLLCQQPLSLATREGVQC